MTLRFFVDSADPRNWDKFLKRGWVFGATTNPLILKREGRGCDMETYMTLVSDARNLGLQQLHIQATGDSVDALTDAGHHIAALWDHVVVKMPLTKIGIEAATKLAAKNIPLTFTACYAAHQMIPALTLDTAYIAPYFGRLIDAGEDGIKIVERMRQMRDHSGSETRILIASLRNVEQVEMLMGLGHDTFTLVPTVADEIAISSLSQEASDAFETAANTLNS